MFQVEINHFFQSFDSGLMRFLMQFISLFGYAWVLTPLLILILFGVDLRKGISIIQVVLWTSIGIGFFKSFFDLPRPYDVDAGLIPFGAKYTLEAGRFAGRGAAGFFRALPEDVLSVLRAAGIRDNGFPSGHVALATSLFGAISLLFRKPWVHFVSVAVILLMPVSRMFLARHFLADTLGGFVLGGIILLGFWWIIQWQRKNTAADDNPDKFSKMKIYRRIFFLVLPAGLCFVPGVGPEYITPMIGVNLAYLLLFEKEVPVFRAFHFKSALRVLLVVGLFVLFRMILRVLPDPQWKILSDMVLPFVMLFLTVYLGAWLCRRTGLFEQAGKAGA